LMNDKVGLALGIVNDKSGLIGKFSTYLNYSYKIPVAYSGTLAFGLAAGFSQHSYDAGRATYEDMQHPGFLEGKYNYIDPDARFGVYFSTNKFFVGLSATNLISSFLSSDDKARRTIISQANHFFLTAGYLFELNEFLKFKPSFMVKEDTKGPTGIDGNINFLLADKVWIGGAYRSNVKLFGKTDFTGNTRGSGIVGLIQFVGNTWNIGYSYDYSVSSLKSFSPSHEISVGFVLNRKNDFGILSPRYF
ncbi:type IX secretion system membrane protein PorP/SprF, partial [Pseudoxanthomonas sp. SGD-10]